MSILKLIKKIKRLVCTEIRADILLDDNFIDKIGNAIEIRKKLGFIKANED